jgi:hypothetical protein
LIRRNLGESCRMRERGVPDGKTEQLSGIVPEATSADADKQRLLRLILYDALASETMGTLTTGVFLVGFAVALGAGNFAIGVLAAVHNLQVDNLAAGDRTRTN